jgi:hypothetical protein
VVRLIGKNQLDKAGWFDRADGRLEGALHRRCSLALATSLDIRNIRILDIVYSVENVDTCEENL